MNQCFPGLNRRPTRALAIVLLLALPALMLSGCQRKSPFKRVAVLDFENTLPGENTEHLSRAMAELLNSRLLNDSRIAVVDRQDVIESARDLGAPLPLARESQHLQRLGKKLGIDYFVLGTLARLEDNYIINVRLYSTATGQDVPGTSYSKYSKREEDFYPLIEPLSQFITYQVANYDKRVELARQQAQTQSQAGQAAPSN